MSLVEATKPAPRAGGEAADALPATAPRSPIAGGQSQVRVGAVQVEGTLAPLAAETTRLVASLGGRTLTAQAIFEAAAGLKRAYAEAGLILVRVVVPPQNLRNGGTLRLLVVNGFIEGINADRVPERVRAKVLDYVQPLLAQRDLTRRTLERRLLLAGDIPGLTLRSSLTPGQQVGGTVLVLEGTHRPVGFDVSYDNSLSRALGRNNLTLSPSFNSPFGLGEQFYASFSGRPDEDYLQRFSPRRVLAGGMILPLGNDGLSFNIEGVVSDTFPITDPAALQTAGTFERIVGRLLYPLIRARDETLIVRGSFEAVDEAQTAPDFGVTLYDDRVRPLRFGLDYTRVLASGTTLNANGEVSQGIEGLGSRGREDATLLRPISRQGADDEFTKAEFRGRAVQVLPFNFALEGLARGQVTFTGPLVNSERFSLGGPRALSAFDVGEFVGDSGWLARGELQYNFTLAVPTGSLLFTPYGFLAHGEVFNENRTAVEARRLSASASGFGIRVFAAGAETTLVRQGELNLEAARQIDNPTGPEAWRFNINAAIRF
jgi:hemolysin activation/secretion protein